MIRLCIPHRKHHGKIHGIPRCVLYVYVPVVMIHIHVPHPGGNSHVYVVDTQPW